MSNKLEYCFCCGEPTGKAGRSDDSIYCECGAGPLCDECWEMHNCPYKEKPGDCTMPTVLEIVEMTLAKGLDETEQQKPQLDVERERQQLEDARMQIHDSLVVLLSALDGKYGLTVEKQKGDSHWSFYLNANRNKESAASVYTFTPWDRKVHWRVPGVPGSESYGWNESYPDKFAEEFGTALAKWIAKMGSE